MTTDKTLYQCVPNFSEGRRSEVVEAIAAAIRETPDARLIDYSADVDHNRCVMTILGDEEAISMASMAAARVAVAKIDLRTHTGVHPRAGALDVLPVVPIFPPIATDFEAENGRREKAVALAKRMGEGLATELALPVYFYEWAARSDRRSALPELRKGGFEAFVHTPLIGALAPDFGPPAAHPSAGIAIVGARAPLVAYNINLETTSIAVARAVARRVREERDRLPELTGVRALGLFLASQNRAQVSMNLTLPLLTTLPGVFAFVEAEATRLGVSVVESEIIGAIPQASLGGQAPEAIRWSAYRPAQILESWLPGSA